MTVAELIAQLQALPPDLKIITSVGDYGYAKAEGPLVRWARPQNPGASDWWQVYWSPGDPKFSMGFEHVVVIS